MGIDLRDVRWCPRPESNRYAPITEAADFKSDVSTNFTTRARRTYARCRCVHVWRRGPESNRTNRICNPGHNRFATAPLITIVTGCENNTVNKKGKLRASLSEFGAGKESRTLDLNLGKVALYQLSYSRIRTVEYKRQRTLSDQIQPLTADENQWVTGVAGFSAAGTSITAATAAVSSDKGTGW